MFYPYNSELQNASESFDMGNFSLWFNKLIPLNNENKCKPCDHKGNDKEAVQYYKTKYDGIKRNSTLKKILEKKHSDQMHFCKNYGEAGYEIVVFQAELKSPLITGIGQSHPNEAGMVFDHTIGIPYIPASSIKGVVRFAHTLGLINSNNSAEFIKSDKKGEYIDEMNKKTMIPDLFGGDLEKKKNGKKEIEKLRGKIIFLDAYSGNVPDLHVDIMNPHYGDYFSDEKGETPPADYLDPTPIKFLTVKPGTTFIFRALFPKNSDLKDHVIKAYERALSVEGVGAKTAVGYGRFDIEISLGSASELHGAEPQEVAEAIQTPLEKLLKEMELIKATDMGRIGTVIQKIDTLETDEDKGKVAKAIRDKIGKKTFKKHKKRDYLIELIEKV